MTEHWQVKTKSSHSETVEAGTVVRFHLEPRPDPASNDFQWHIEGPFTGMSTLVSGGATFDWDTEGLRAGAYDIYATWVPKQGATGGDSPVPVQQPVGSNPMEATLGGNAARPADQQQVVATSGGSGGAGTGSSKPWKQLVASRSATNPEGVVPVSLQRTALLETIDQALWVIIRNRTNAISFRPYKEFIDGVMSSDVTVDSTTAALPFRGGDAYNLLKFATDAFLMQEVGVLDPFGAIRAGLVSPLTRGAGVLDSDVALASLDQQLKDPAQAEELRTTEERRLGRPLDLTEIKQMRDSYYKQLKEETPPPLVLPYLNIIRERLADIPLKSVGEIPRDAYGILRSRLTAPLAIELIWSYWHEQGMLAQTLNAILARFQNRKLINGRPDPLARFDVDPLRPLANIFWGWMEDDVHRLTVRRRHFEYEHEYGLRLSGRAIPPIEPVDRRSKFLEAFHNLLFLCHVFFKEDDDTTVIADGFPVLNALRETHLLLAEGAHNQFGDLPSTARAEMMVMEWLLARPEMRDFLGGRVMVPYEEAWMDRVDTMKSMQGWLDVTITHFRDMGVFGEQILLSIRYGNWSVENDPQTAANWARYWRPEIQRYVHAYRSASGADLTERVDVTPPSLLLRRRMADQQAELDGGRPRGLEGRRERLPGVLTRRSVPVQRQYE
jgi:hypothetical protein